MPTATPVSIDCEHAVTGPQSEPIRRPLDFEPVGAYVCDPYGLLTDAPGSGTLDYGVIVLDGDLAPLIRALDVADSPPATLPCAAVALLVPGLWLADSQGNVIRVAYPADGCGNPKRDPVNAAIKDLIA
jgi:hypothetical protein